MGADRRAQCVISRVVCRRGGGRQRTGSSSLSLSRSSLNFWSANAHGWTEACAAVHSSSSRSTAVSKGMPKTR